MRIQWCRARNSPRFLFFVFVFRRGGEDEDGFATEERFAKHDRARPTSHNFDYLVVLYWKNVFR